MTIKRLLLSVPPLFFGWGTVLVFVGLLTDDAPASVVLFPSTEFLSSLPPTTSIMATSRYSVTVTSDMSGFAMALYRSGALIVLPAGLPGCLPLPQSRTVMRRGTITAPDA